MTDGDPQSNNDSSLAGTDFRYRNSQLPGGRLLEGQAWYQESDNVGRQQPHRRARSRTTTIARSAWG